MQIKILILIVKLKSINQYKYTIKDKIMKIITIENHG
jgi:hypothetical protein